MTEYHVIWEIDLDADTPRDAARKALEIHRDPASIADVFTVIDGTATSVQVDLADEREPVQPEEAVCRHCQRRIVNVPGDGWVDPEATGDDSMWRETCDRHDTRQADHEPVEADTTIADTWAESGGSGGIYGQYPGAVDG